MYEPHAAFKTPRDQFKIWRYMAFEQLADILLSSQLAFTRIDCFEDPWEGTYPKKTLEALDDAKRKSYQCAAVYARKHALASCWHLADHESDALWRNYSARSCAVAIESSIARLKQALSMPGLKVHIGAVSYIDYGTEEISISNIFHTVLHKRRSFAHENEVRALLFNPGEEAPRKLTWADVEREAEQPSPYTPRVRVPIQVDELIETVHVAPQADASTAQTVRRLAKLLGFSFEVRHSELYRPPS